LKTAKITVHSVSLTQNPSNSTKIHLSKKMSLSSNSSSTEDISEYSTSCSSSSSSSNHLPPCVVCHQKIENDSNIAISPYPEQVHGHCWLHIIHKDSPIPWPKEIPVWKNNKNNSKSEKYAMSQKSMAESSQTVPLPPTIKKVFGAYRVFSKEVDKFWVFYKYNEQFMK